MIEVKANVRWGAPKTVIASRKGDQKKLQAFGESTLSDIPWRGSAKSNG